MAATHVHRQSLILVDTALLTLLLWPASGLASDLDRFELLGPVKTVVTKHPQLQTTHQFDRNGLLISLELFANRETQTARYLFVHDTEGRITEEQTLDPNGAIAQKILFRHVLDQRGRQTAMVASTETGMFTHAEFSTYDRRGFLAEELYIANHGASEKSLFDVRHNLVYHARYYQGKLTQEATHHYGPLGRLRESRYYGPDGDMIRKDLYRYNEGGQLLEQQSEFYRQTHRRKSVATYDLDHVGNWIKETIHRSSEKNGAVVPTEILVNRERTITYY
jgi:hypothetical protein